MLTSSYGDYKAQISYLQLVIMSYSGEKSPMI